MDTSRTQRRFNIYLNSVKEFLTYFKNQNKLLTVDTSCGDIEAVWDSVSDYVVDADISKPRGVIEQVVLFKLNPHDFDEIDRDRYPIKDVSMSDLAVKDGASPVGFPNSTNVKSILSNSSFLEIFVLLNPGLHLKRRHKCNVN